jgi:hypothetical protein
MRRALRWTFNGLTALSLLLCAATIVSWIRSYWRSDQIVYGPFNTTTFAIVTAARGRLQFGVAGEARAAFPYPLESSWSHASGEATDLYPLLHRLLGGEWGHRVDLPPWFSTRAAVAIPYGYAAVLFATLPAVAYLRRARRLRFALRGHCRICGYDLRATPDRCPEMFSLL